MHLYLQAGTREQFTTEQHVSTFPLPSIFFFQVSGPSRLRRSLSRFATSLKLAWLALLAKHRANLKYQSNRSTFIIHDESRHKLVTHENRHLFAWAVEISHTTNMARSSLAGRNVRLFLQILQSGSFRFKTKLRTSLPGKYRNGVVVAVCNLAVFP